MARIIDTHTHIYLKQFASDRDEMIARSRKAGVDIWLLPAIDSTTHGDMVDLADALPGAYAMMGLHPCSVTADYQTELDQVASWFARRAFIAVGECGLDFYWDKTYVTQQYEVFRWQLKLGLQHNLPVVIHSRDAMDECIDVVAEFPGVRTVFHCFNGSISQGERIRSLGGYLGIGGVLTYKNSGMDKVMAGLGLDRVILETDAPYLTPVPYRGKRNEPSYTIYVAEKLAEVTGLSLEEIAAVTTANAERLFFSEGATETQGHSSI